jgi:hypothetical protein
MALPIGQVGAGGVVGPAARDVPANRAASAPARTATAINRFIVVSSLENSLRSDGFSRRGAHRTAKAVTPARRGGLPRSGAFSSANGEPRLMGNSLENALQRMEADKRMAREVGSVSDYPLKSAVSPPSPFSSVNGEPWLLDNSL